MFNFALTQHFLLAYTADSIAKQEYHGHNPRKWTPHDGVSTCDTLTGRLFDILVKEGGGL